MIGNLKKEGLFKSMFHLTAEGVLVFNKDAIILMANPACKNFFDHNADVLLDEHINILIVEKHREELENYLLNLKKIADFKHLDVLGIKKYKTQFNLEIGLNAIAINDKNACIAFLRDTNNYIENILKIKQTNEVLLKGNRKFDALINNVKGILFRCENNRDYTMHYISEGCLEITGYAFEYFNNGCITYDQLILDTHRNRVWENLETATKQNKPYDCEYRMRHKNGSIKYVWEKGEAIYNTKNKDRALEGFIADITNQKETETKLRYNQAKTKALLEAIAGIIFNQDRKGNYLDCCSNSPQKVLWPRENFIGLNIKDVFPASVHKKIKASHKEVVAFGILQIVDDSVKGEKVIEHYEARLVLMNNYSLLTIVKDVTEEKARDAQLNIKDNALASASISITIADAQKPDVPIIYCSTAFEKITGYKKEEVYGKNCNFLQDDDRDQKEIDVMKKAIVKGDACNMVLRNYRKDSTLYCNDVTNKVKAEDLKDRIQNILELIAQDKPLNTTIKKTIDTAEAYLKDCIGSILQLNKVDKTHNLLVSVNLPKTFCNFIDGTLIGRTVASCGTAAFFKKKVVVSNVKTSVLWEDYKNIALKNGLIACCAFPIMSSTNKIRGTLCMYSSLARHPLAEEKEMLLDMIYLASIAIEKYNNTMVLEESKKQLELYAHKLEEKVQERTKEVTATVRELVAVNHNLEDQILIRKQAEVDAFTSKILTVEVAKNFPRGLIAVVNTNSQLVLAEGEALEELGLKPPIFEGMKLDNISIFTEEQKARLKEDISKTLSGQHLSFEIEYKNRYFNVNTAPLFDENNQIIYALMVYNDISEQKEIEFSIQSALKKEKELNELKSRFVSMASHEFRTPLSAILTSAVLIGKQNEPRKGEKREKYVAQIERNVKHLVTILNDFLSLSKLEEGKMGAIKEHFDIIRLSKILINENKVNLKTGQHISFNALKEHLFVNLDAKLVRHVITNLLSNASKYSEENISIDFKIEEHDNKVLIQISDRRIGIPEKEQKHLFNRFFRPKNANNIQGKGLGLNIAKHYVELMVGTIGCTSKLNVGTTFWVKFPIEG